MSDFSPVYGPVRSWRYGKSLGIDPIGLVSTCSFNCVYCQLGAIERLSLERQVFVPTQEILPLMEQRKDEAVDVITLSGSGEPTLALNLGEIMAGVKRITTVPVVVLTNGTLLQVEVVRQDLALADEVSVKLDGVTLQRINQINRPVFAWNLQDFFNNLLNFRKVYDGKLTIQTMIVSPWTQEEEQLYMEQLRALQPKHIYLNNPRRPKPKSRLVEGRENLTAIANASWFKPISRDYLAGFAQRIHDYTGVPVSHVMEDYAF
jgi:wyosine [tRNA(Phe)-imidazoG37] synthetase (radical SAM superfamily)